MKCALCGSNHISRIFRLCDNMKIMGKSFPDEPSFVAQCDDCGLVFTDSTFTQEDLLSYYREGAVAPNYYDMFGKEDTEEYYMHLLDLIKDYIDYKSSILDIAGSWGEFSGYLNGLGYKNVIDLDPNEKCIKSASEKGIKTIQADTTDMSKVEKDSVDLVILNHTMEHILDVKTAMEEIDRVLKRDGYLFIEVPDVNGYEKEAAAPFNFLTYEHVIHFSMNDIENLAAIYGFEIVRSGYYYKKVSNYPSIYAVMKKSKESAAKYSSQPGESIRRYIDKSKNVLSAFIEPLRVSGEPLILWGIGASTTILIDAFEGCNVSALIDRNPARQGLEFNINNRKYKVQDPSTVSEGTIVILSIPYYESIAKQIREMGLKNKIVALK